MTQITSEEIKETALRNITESLELKTKLPELMPEIEKAVELLNTTIANGNKVLVCGNGGSSSDVQHFSGELIGRFRKERRALPCIALSANTCVLTAWSNDYEFETVFKRQVEALGNKGDMIMGLSTSGNSKNIVEAFKQAKSQGVSTFGLLGNGGGKIKGVSDVSIVIPSSDTARIQEMHILIIHILCELLEKSI